MKRIKGKEIMDKKEEVLFFAKNTKNSVLNKSTINYFINNYPLKNARILDMGSGTAEISIKLIQQIPEIKEIVAIDASQEMISYAKKEIKLLELEKKIKVIRGKVPGIEKKLKPLSFDIIFSGYLLHHIPNPLLFWEEIKKLSNKKTSIYILDFIRPNNKKEAQKIMIENFSFKKDMSLQEDAYHSLLASFSVNEVKKQLEKTGLDLEIEIMNDFTFIAKRVVK
jgi:ubiquinone/menaquinone biosynthesis C-methylase UbiE